MYKKLELFTDECSSLKLTKKKDFLFAKNITQIPLGASELFNAGINYPFLLNKDNAAVAIVSLKTKSNPYILKNGNYKEDVYIPLFLQNYPFVYVKYEKELSLAYDVNSKHIGNSLDIALYNEDGTLTDFFQKKIATLNMYEQSKIDLSMIIKQLFDMKLVSENNFIKSEQINLNFVDLFYVDEEKLNNLTDKEIASLVKTGAYKVAIAQLMSMKNFAKLLNQK
jgi:hypothetical protein